MSAESFHFHLFIFFSPPLCYYSFVTPYFLWCLSCCENISAMFLSVVIILIKAVLSVVVTWVAFLKQYHEIS